VRRNSTGSTGRRFSSGTIWNVGGSGAASGDSVYPIDDGRGGFTASGSNAPLYSANFFTQIDPVSERDLHERRIALALDVDASARVFSTGSFSSASGSPDSSSDLGYVSSKRIVWKNNEWSKEGSTSRPKKSTADKRAVPVIPFRVLDAPALRDDYYCSVLAYSDVAKVLAVGLGNTVYFWSESGSVESPEALNPNGLSHVSSLDFSSEDGGKAVLAIGRSNGQVMLYSPLEDEPRFDSHQPIPVCCVCFRPNVVKKASLRDPHLLVDTEEILVGDEIGHVYLYSVEWPSETERDLFGWPGSLSLVARIIVHTQQICGLAWSTDRDSFATGGNDNLCYLFDRHRVKNEAAKETIYSGPAGSPSSLSGSSRSRNINLSSPPFNINALCTRHCFAVAAAVKAISFCPWQRGLLAIGGGSNDRRIHFFHTLSGAALAAIDCHAQVTSLIWSTTRREIAATFGFAQPEHPYRIVVFKWPSCEVVVKIPWFDQHRALYAIPYPGGPNLGRGRKRPLDWASHRRRRGRGSRRASPSSRPDRHGDRGSEGGVW
jgi:WD40 repeat protein